MSALLKDPRWAAAVGAALSLLVKYLDARVSQTDACALEYVKAMAFGALLSAMWVWLMAKPAGWD